MTNDIPTFTPPAPTFVPPQQSSGSNGNACYYHQNEPAVAKCAKCGKPICQDCYDTYQVAIGEYAGKALCYDCCQEIVAENVKELKKQRRKIATMYIFTLLGMLFGFLMGHFAIEPEISSGGGVGLVTIIATFVGGCLWTFIVNLARILGGVFKAMAQDFSIGTFIGCFFVAIWGFIKAIFISIWGTIQKLFYYTKHLIKTSGFIKSDSNCLQEMKDYMEYTMVRSRNVGVDLATLMNEGSELYNNSYAQAVVANGEENAESRIRNCVTSINENGEIIRNFAA